MSGLLYRDALARLIAQAPPLDLQRLTHHSFEWDVSGDCLRRLTRELFARADRGQTKHLDWQPGRPGPLRLILHVRCRKCEPCRMQRRNLWAARAHTECERAMRTWFGTVTCRPGQVQEALNRIRASHARNGDDFDAFPEETRFRLLSNELGKLVTKALKRLRKNTQVPFRNLMVAEAHESGWPHWHLLIHEVLITRPFVKNQDLKPTFEATLGHTNFKLVKNRKRGIWYVTKYVAKAAPTRVRASQAYGRGPDAAKTIFDHRADFESPPLEGGSGGV